MDVARTGSIGLLHGGRGHRKAAVELHTTALLPLLQQEGAQFVPYAGWKMPVRFSSDLAEHKAVREAAGLFDLSHMGQIEVSGPGAAAALDAALPTLPSAMEAGRARYSLLLAENGGILDDLIVYRLADSEYLVVANGANRVKVIDALTTRAAPFGAQVLDHTFARAMIAIQGPAAARILAKVTTESFDELRYYRIMTAHVAGAPCLLARTGYTGEDGFEILVGFAGACGVWQALREAGGAELVPAGLAARDTLRLEAGMPLYGNELNEETTPAAAGLGRVVNLDHEFTGRAALLGASAPSRVLVGLQGQGRRAPRAGSAILDAAGVEVGKVTSGVLSPTLGYPIALASLDTACAEVGSELVADVRGTQLPVTVVPTPFYRRAK